MFGWLRGREPSRALSQEDFVVILSEENGCGGGDGEYCLDATTDRPSLFFSESFAKSTIPLGQAALSQVSSALESGCPAKIIRQTECVDSTLEKQRSTKRKSLHSMGSFDILDMDDLIEAGVSPPTSQTEPNSDVCDSILVQKIRLVSRENSKEDYLLLINPQPTGHESKDAVQPPALPTGASLQEEASHPLGTSSVHTQITGPTQLDFASSSYEFGSTFDQLASAQFSNSTTSLVSSPSSTQGISSQHPVCPPYGNAQLAPSSVQSLHNGSTNGSETHWPENGEGGPSSVPDVAHVTISEKHHLSWHHSSSDDHLPGKLSDKLAGCCLESNGIRMSGRSVVCPSNGNMGTQGGTQLGSQLEEDLVGWTGGVACNGEEVERDGPHNGGESAGVVAEDTAKLTSNVMDKKLPSKLADIGKKLTHKNDLQKRQVSSKRVIEEEDDMRSQSAEQLEQYTHGASRLRTRASDPGKSIYLKKKSVLDISRAISEPSQADLIDPVLLKEFSSGHVSSECHSEVSSVTNLLPPNNESLSETRTGCLPGSGDLPGTPSEQSIKRCIHKHCTDFISYTNWKVLLPHLMAKELLDSHITSILMSNYMSDQEKGLEFYVRVLPTKGSSAYSMFYSSIADEKEHSGHRTLLELIDNFSVV